MRRPFSLFSLFVVSVLFIMFAMPLAATESFWSDLPSTQTIERHDSLTGFDITRYELTLAINDQAHSVTGNVIAHVTAENNLTQINYELTGGTLAVTSVLVNNVASAYTHTNGIINIPLNISAGQQFTTEIAYSGTTGLSPAPYNIGLKYNGSSIYTLSNPDAGRYWWPSYDHPWDKALIDLHITVRSDWLVSGNGTRQGIVDNGNGTKTHTWICNYPVATYVVGITAGPFVEFNQTAGTLPIQNFVTQSQLAAAQTDFSNVPEMIDFFSTVYGPYPFEKYGHAVVPISPYAAMEHQTMTTLGSNYVTGNLAYESIVAHELAHQWMGNAVTPLTMQDVWLKESFATYSEFLWEAYNYGWTAGLSYLASDIQQYYISWENSNGPHTIYNPVYNELFAPPTYEKSASVLHMLRLKLGNDEFFQFVQNYYDQYFNGNVITADIIAAAEESSGVDLTQFFRQWIYSPGIPSANLTFFTNGVDLCKVIANTTSPTATTFDIEIPLMLTGSALLDSVVVRATPTGFANYVLMNPAADDLASIQIDPHHWVLNRGYTRNTFQLTQCLPASNSVTLFWNALVCPVTIVSYNIYRRELPNGTFSLLNNHSQPVLSYTDLSAENGISYQYYLAALDAEGWESQPTNTMNATPIEFPFDWGFLVVDETRDGTGTLLNPTDAMVDGFYNSVLSAFPHSNWDVASQGLPTLNTLSHYPIVLWHSDDYTEFYIDDAISTLGSYVLSGGALLVSGWKYPSALPQSFFDAWFEGIVPLLLNSAVLVSANSSAYPDLYPDPIKLSPTWNGMLSMAYVFPESGGVLYTAEISGGGTGNGDAIAIRSFNTGNNGGMLLLGFPLYYMQQDSVQAFLNIILQELYPDIVANADDTLIPTPLSLSCYPNPFSDNLTIRLTQKTNTPVTVSIYNLKGQKVKEWQSEGKQDIVWDGRDNLQRFVSSGVYTVRLSQDGESVSARVTLFRK
jgi:hypothetical protein